MADSEKTNMIPAVEFTTAKKLRTAQLGQLTKIYKNIERQMISAENSEHVKNLSNKLCERFEQFKMAHLQCLDLCDDSETIDTLEASFVSQQKNLEEFRERYEEWQAQNEKCNDHMDNISVISGTSTVRSTRTQLLSAKAKRLVAENKLKKLAKKHEFELARRELEQQQEMYDHQCDLEEAEIEESVWQEALEDTIPHLSHNDDASRIEHSENESTSGSLHGSCDSQLKENRNTVSVFSRNNPDKNCLHSQNSPKYCDNHSTNTNAHCGSVVDSGSGLSGESATSGDNERREDGSLRRAQITTSSNSHDNILTNSSGSAPDNTVGMETAFKRLAETLQEGFNLPKPELLTFNGSPADYCKFIKNFETNIECKISDERLRLSYLIQYCQGEARYSIEDCVLLEPSAGYNRARDILLSRYGRPHVIARSYVEKLVYGPPIAASDTDNLSKLCLEMQKCEITLSQLGFTTDVDNSENLRRIVRRLPMHMRTKWADIAHGIIESGREPRFHDVVKFVDERSRVASSMYGVDLIKDNGNKRVYQGNANTSEYRGKITTLSLNTDGNSHIYERKCICCSGSCSDLASCDEFTSMSLNDRISFIRKLKFCFNCLKPNHLSYNCRKPKACTVSDCKMKHNTLLHSWVKVGSDHTVSQPSFNCAATTGPVRKTCLGIIPVTVRGRNGNYYKTYALLDDGADKTLCDERLIKTLEVDTKPVTFRISTVNSTGSETVGREVDLCVQSIDGDNEVQLRSVWSVKKLPISTRSAASNVDISKITYLRNIQIPEVTSSDVMLLIGTDAPEAHIPLEVRSGDGDQPYAIRSRLGWAIRGPVPGVDMKTCDVNINFGVTNDIILQQQLERMWTSDFGDTKFPEKECMSVEDKHALEMMKSTLTFEDGHYKMGLPWRHEETSLPNNMPLAQARLQQLKRKLLHNEKLHEMYTKTVTDYIHKGYATEVLNYTNSNSKRVWYLPHHPVTNENKPGKVRVVFDCAAKYSGVSLNSQLLQGPDFINSLVGVVIRFRQEPIALVADIEAMFHQVRVQTDDTDALRFLWWPGGDINQKPKIYNMQVHLFGATSSPSCAGYALKRTALDNAKKFDPDVASSVNKNFYVDDCLKSVATERKAIQLASDLQSMLKMGGFRLTKWLSNSRNVLQAIPETERAPSVVNLNPSDSLPCDRALGVLWDVNDDKIKFKVEITDKPHTRRGILSTVSSIFDPLGLVSPVTLRAKAIVQDLCRQKLSWDEQIPQKTFDNWKNWLTNLPHLETLTINRCFRPESFGDIKNAQLHFFSDGSELGYGACAYLRLTDIDNNISCCLVVGKSRLAPLKQISIPRLELSGAVVACRLYEMLRQELDINIDQVTFWTDSTIVLGYINNSSRRFKTFVGNRLSVIHEITSNDLWRHVDTDSNPADIASRGTNADDTRRLTTWLNGPEFLLKEPSQWPSMMKTTDVAVDDNEVKKDVETFNVTTDTYYILDKIIEHYSDLTRLQRAVAWLIRFQAYCRHRFLKNINSLERGDLTLEEIKTAQKTIISRAQVTYFADEMNSILNQKPVKKSSRLASLNPIVEDGLIRMNGRHQYKTPIILPDAHHVSTLIIRHIHETKGHVGQQQVLSYLRRNYWILRGPSSVKKILNKCMLCKRQNAPLLRQQMAPLITEQTTPEKPPFTYTGVDFFGPLNVKSGRSVVKRYGCLFTCLTTRAVHLEIAHSLTTSSFISALQRFISRRGTPEVIHSDNGTNFVGGDKELKRSIKEWNKSEIGKYMIQQEIDWKFNPPAASHMGGTWERLIRSTRSILTALVQDQLLSDEQLVTLMTEVEKILNDRPITAVSTDPRDQAALTPSMLLLMKSNQCLPIGVFQKHDNYAKRWWRQVQYMADIFWKRWLHEYLPALQVRYKWQRKTTNLRKGDLVLIVTENTQRGQWPLARVVEVNVGRDGHVRSCVVRSRGSESVRPITKLCLLESD